ILNTLVLIFEQASTYAIWLGNQNPRRYGTLIFDDPRSPGEFFPSRVSEPDLYRDGCVVVVDPLSAIPDAALGCWVEPQFLRDKPDMHLYHAGYLSKYVPGMGAEHPIRLIYSEGTREFAQKGYSVCIFAKGKLTIPLTTCFLSLPQSRRQATLSPFLTSPVVVEAAFGLMDSALGMLSVLDKAQTRTLRLDRAMADREFLRLGMFHRFSDFADDLQRASDILRRVCLSVPLDEGVGGPCLTGRDRERGIVGEEPSPSPPESLSLLSPLSPASQHTQSSSTSAEGEKGEEGEMGKGPKHTQTLLGSRDLLASIYITKGSTDYLIDMCRLILLTHVYSLDTVNVLETLGEAMPALNYECLVTSFGVSGDRSAKPVYVSMTADDVWIPPTRSIPTAFHYIMIVARALSVRDGEVCFRYSSQSQTDVRPPYCPTCVKGDMQMVSRREGDIVLSCIGQVEPHAQYLTLEVSVATLTPSLTFLSFLHDYVLAAPEAAETSDLEGSTLGEGSEFDSTEHGQIYSEVVRMCLAAVLNIVREARGLLHLTSIDAAASDSSPHLKTVDGTDVRSLFPPVNGHTPAQLYHAQMVGSDSLSWEDRTPTSRSHTAPGLTLTFSVPTQGPSHPAPPDVTSTDTNTGVDVHSPTLIQTYEEAETEAETEGYRYTPQSGSPSATGGDIVPVIYVPPTQHHPLERECLLYHLSRGGVGVGETPADADRARCIIASAASIAQSPTWLGSGQQREERLTKCIVLVFCESPSVYERDPLVWKALLENRLVLTPVCQSTLLRRVRDMLMRQEEVEGDAETETQSPLVGSGSACDMCDLPPARRLLWCCEDVDQSSVSKLGRILLEYETVVHSSFEAGVSRLLAERSGNTSDYFCYVYHVFRVCDILPALLSLRQWEARVGADPIPFVVMVPGDPQHNGVAASLTPSLTPTCSAGGVHEVEDQTFFHVDLSCNEAHTTLRDMLRGIYRRRTLS
ncbi:hypothetical protein KIPB_008433, partial [Kipferlia bialata]